MFYTILTQRSFANVRISKVKSHLDERQATSKGQSLVWTAGNAVADLAAERGAQLWGDLRAVSDLLNQRSNAYKRFLQYLRAFMVQALQGSANRNRRYIAFGR